MGKRSFLKDSKFVDNSRRVRKSRESSILSFTSYRTGIVYEEDSIFYNKIDTSTTEHANPVQDHLQIIDSEIRDEIVFHGEQKTRTCETLNEFLLRGGKIRQV